MHRRTALKLAVVLTIVTGWYAVFAAAGPKVYIPIIRADVPPTPTATETPSPTSTATDTALPTPTATDTATSTEQPADLPTMTATLTATASPSPTTKANCDPSYPTVCIPPPPPDLDCKDIPYRNFTVLPPDPHHFDTDHDGIGCEK
jgi:hypothetical protein